MAAGRFVGKAEADLLRDSFAYRALPFHLLLNGLMRQNHGCLTRDKAASFALICCRQRLMNPPGSGPTDRGTPTGSSSVSPGRTWMDSLLLLGVSTFARASANTLSSLCSIIWENQQVRGSSPAPTNCRTEAQTRRELPARQAFLRRRADLFSAGSLWWGRAATAPLGRAGP